MNLQNEKPKSEIMVKVISPEGRIFISYFPDDTLIQEVKSCAVGYFYPTGETSQSRYKIVKVFDGRTLHDFLTLAQDRVVMQEELLLVARRVPESGTLWDFTAPQPGAIAAATASLPAPENTLPQLNLSSLLTTNEVSVELKKILISLIETGAKLVAAGKNYENGLAQLCYALEEPSRQPTTGVIQVMMPPADKASMPNQPGNQIQTGTDVGTCVANSGNNTLKRAEHLQRFLDKFQEWKTKIAEPITPEEVVVLTELGFPSDAADQALRYTGKNLPAAASWLIGERGSSIFELVHGLPADSLILEALLKQPQIQRGLLNTRNLVAFISMVAQTGNAALWLNSPHENWLLTQITMTYHSEKYCMAVNQFTGKPKNVSTAASTSRQRR